MPSSTPLSETAERRVAPHELFFSSTDQRGIIRSVNSVFMRVSRYTAPELIGVPHNLERHPDMPAGIFRLMWDRLLAGRPAAAYVTNRAKDGVAYRVFATVTPMGSEFLSVRMAPVGPLAEPAERVYAQVLTVERELSRSLPAARVAAVGAEEIQRHLAGLGFAGYDEFMVAALPGEVSGRGPLLTTALARPHATGRLAQILDGAALLYAQLDDMVEQLDTYQQLATRLGPATDAVVGHALSLQHAVDAARSASADVADRSSALLNVAKVMGQPMAKAVEALEQLAADLRAMRSEVADLGLRIGLARLHTEMVGAFAAEVIDGHAPESSLAEVTRLCDAVDTGVQAMARAVQEVNASLTGLADRIAESGRLMQDFRTFLGQWRILVLRRRQPVAVAQNLGPIDSQLDSMTDHLAHLDSLADQCRGAVATFDRASVEAPLEQIRAGAGYSPGVSGPALTRDAALDIALARARARTLAPVPIWR